MAFVLGMGGGSASGKSTLARALAAALGSRALLMTHDRYYHSLPEHLRDNPLDYNFDHPDSLDTARLVADLDLLLAGKPADLPVYDFPNHRRAEQVQTVEPHDILIVEGILVLTDAALRQRFDHSVYVHTPDDIRLLRRIRRDRQRRGRDVNQVLDQYEATVRPMHHAFVEPSREHADTVVLGTDPVDALVDSVLSVLPAAV